MDYDGVMGVPITFLDKYNPDQFEIVGISGVDDSGQDVPAADQVADGAQARTKLNDGAA